MAEPTWSEELVQAYCNEHGWERTGKFMTEEQLGQISAELQVAEDERIPELRITRVATVRNKINELASYQGLPKLDGKEKYFFIGTGEFTKKWRSL